MMDTNGYWPWSDSAKLVCQKEKGGLAAGEMKESKKSDKSENFNILDKKKRKK